MVCFVTAGPENRCAPDFLCVGAGIKGKNSRQQFDECPTVVTCLGLSPPIRLRPTSRSRSGWTRKPLIARLKLMCFGTPRDWQRSCCVSPLLVDSSSCCAFKWIQNVGIKESQWPCREQQIRAAAQTRAWGTITAGRLWLDRFRARADSALTLWPNF
jgi:hypothetical protein